MNNIIEEEKKYLEYAKESLKNQIESCKKELVEIPKMYTKALQGDAFLVESLMSVAATKLRKLEMSEKAPYFGRIDFLSDGSNNVSKLYIGKTNINGKNNDQVTIDWRTPVCSLYYDSDLGKASYEAPAGLITGDLQLKRQIVIKNGELCETINTGLVSNDELLQPYLSVNADNKMKTIIASIQKEQYKIIKRPISDNIVVQGVAGSGKTSVALHRIAYLVYNMGEQIKSNQFLVIGPNKYFLNYISTILPELETEPVEQKTYLDIVNESLGEKLTLEDTNTILNNDKNMSNLKKIQEYKSSLEYRDILSDFVKSYMEKGIVTEGFKIDGEEIYSVENIKRELFSSLTNKPNFDRTCTYFVDNFKDNMESIYGKLNEKYRRIYVSLPFGDAKREEAVQKSNELSKLVKEKGVKLLKDYFKKINLKPLDIYKQFISEISKYDIPFGEEEKIEFQNITASSLKKKKVAFEDLPALLHINNLLYGKSDEYKHIIIDEAQDFGLFHFDVLKNKSPKSTFSIYGDLAQAIYSYRGIKDWDSIVSSIFCGNCEILNLNKSYRTTIEITNNANKVLNTMNLPKADPVIRHGSEITFSDCTKNDDYKIKKINQWLEKGYKTIAIICKSEKEAVSVHKMLEKNNLDNTLIVSNQTQYAGGIFVLTSAQSKGLEFDAVMINDASDNMYSDKSITDMHLLYVASTRALHELEILYNKNLCQVFKQNGNTLDTSKKLIKC